MAIAIHVSFVIHIRLLKTNHALDTHGQQKFMYKNKAKLTTQCRVSSRKFC